MAMIMQRAGDLQLRTFTDGAPYRIGLSTEREDWCEVAVLGMDDLHDLRYAIDRVLAKVAEHERQWEQRQ